MILRKRILFLRALLLFAAIAVIIYTYAAISLKNNQTESDDSEKPSYSEKSLFPTPITEPLLSDTLYLKTMPVEHIFFHPLVAYPKKAFDGDRISKGMDDYMATVTEFKRMLEELYKNDYMLVNIEQVYERTFDEEEGKNTVQRTEFMMPHGKKPFIISIDDMNYYAYMIENGCVHKLVVGEGNRVASYTKHDDGTETIDYDNEIIPILDNFVAKHPDFSLNGAKGCIGLTGFDGILGYRTQSDSKTRKEDSDKVKEVIKVLKDTGWTFASHSYGHPDMAKASYEKLKADTQKWKAEVEPFIGTTPIYLYPYGATVPHGSDKMNYLINTGGFYVFCGVGIRHYERRYSDAIVLDRKNIDGITLRNRRAAIMHMFDTELVIDR